MPETQLCCLAVLATLFGVLSSETGIIKKYGCREDSVKLFKNIKILNDNTVLSLYKNGDTSDLIAEWQNNVFNPKNGYIGKLHLDKYGNIWLLNLREADDATYKLLMGLEENATINEVELVVMVAPTKKCKPEIVRINNSLSAFVDQTKCGKPSASVHWMEHSAFFVTPEVITLQNEQCNCTYHACIKSDALRCVDTFNLADYCAVFKYNTSNFQSTRSESIMTSNISTVTNALLATVCALLILFLIILIGFFIRNIRKLNYPFRRNITKRKVNVPSMTSLNDTSTQAPDDEASVSKGTIKNPSANLENSSSQQAKESNKEENEHKEADENEALMNEQTEDGRTLTKK